jgi:broad specificity phosphatase PhoE
MKSLGWIKEGFYFMRHGESEHNRHDRVNGWTDSSLTVRGEEQARAAAHILSNYPIQRIVTSDLQRARRTAEIVAEALNGIVIEIVPDLRERHWGVYEGQPRAIRPPLHEVPKEGEGPEDYQWRVMAALNQVRPDQSTLIVAHAGTMRVLCSAFEIPDKVIRVQNSSPLFIKTSRPADCRTLCV